MIKPFFKTITFSSGLFISLVSSVQNASAGSLYLPLQLAPEIENRIEKLMVLANMPVIKRPIPVKAVYQAVDKIKYRHPSLANSVDEYLSRFERGAGLTHLGATLSTSQQDKDTSTFSLANQRGRTLESNVNLALSGYWAANDFVAVNFGGVYRDETLADDHTRTTTNRNCDIRRQTLSAQPEPPENLPDCYLDNTHYDGSFISLGWDAAQLDIGYRPHWFGPSQESSMLISTEAVSMPSITLSNVLPFENLWNLQYEVFYAKMSESDGIRRRNDDTLVSGSPKLFGFHTSISPIEGFILGGSRLMQFGGGGKDESLKSLFNAFFNAKKFENSSLDERNFGNQLTSIDARYTFTGKVPVSIYASWAGEDTSKPSQVHLGNSAITWGLHLPSLPFNLNATIEGSEWQNAWYINENYWDGLTHEGTVLGHWGGNRRVFGEHGGAKALTAKVIWDAPNGWQWTNQYRQLKNNTEFSGANYSTSQELQSRLSIPWREWIIGTELLVGTDVFDNKYTQLSGFVRW